MAPAANCAGERGGLSLREEFGESLGLLGCRLFMAPNRFINLIFEFEDLFSESIYKFYYPNLVILPVDNNEHQRIDDVSTDRISHDIRSVETMGFAL